MRQAIETTETGSMILARCQAKDNSYPWNNCLSNEDNHIRAAVALIYDMGWDEWTERIIGGAKADNSGYVFVCIVTERPSEGVYSFGAMDEILAGGPAHDK